MVIGGRLRELRESENLSQGDIGKRTGLLRSYISRMENGHTFPSLETLEKLAQALEVRLDQLFYDGEKAPEIPNLPKRKTTDDIVWGSLGKPAEHPRNPDQRPQKSQRARPHSPAFRWLRAWPLSIITVRKPRT